MGTSITRVQAGSLKKIAEVEQSVSGTELEITGINLDEDRYIMLFDYAPSGNGSAQITFNNDVGLNYATRAGNNYGTMTILGNQAELLVNTNNANSAMIMGVFEFKRDNDDNQWIGLIETYNAFDALSGTSTTLRQISTKWVSASNITSIKLEQNVGNLIAGSKMRLYRYA